MQYLIRGPSLPGHWSSPSKYSHPHLSLAPNADADANTHAHAHASPWFLQIYTASSHVVYRQRISPHEVTSPLSSHYIPPHPALSLPSLHATNASTSRHCRYGIGDTPSSGSPFVPDSPSGSLMNGVSTLVDYMIARSTSPSDKDMDMG